MNSQYIRRENNIVMTKAIIFTPSAKDRRIKFYIPYQAIEWRKQVKKLNTSFYHKPQQLWSIENKAALLINLKNIFRGEFISKDYIPRKQLPTKDLSQESLDILANLEKKIVLKGYSEHTRKSYRGAMIRFLSFFENRDLEQLRKEEIEGFIYTLKTKYKISDNYQITMISAIKFYYEYVLKKPREYYNLTRPKKSKSLPNVLSSDEIIRILSVPKSIKHRAILYTIYSAGLRLNEVITLRIIDVHSENGQLFIKGAKGKKDRYTVLSQATLDILRVYYSAHKPSYWLFEGSAGGQYSKSSVQKIFRRAVKDANINPWATVHTLRHSFATHLMQHGTSMRQVQALLGHSSSKTTEIYTHVMNMSNKTVMSPLDRIRKEVHR